MIRLPPGPARCSVHSRKRCSLDRARAGPDRRPSSAPSMLAPAAQGDHLGLCSSPQSGWPSGRPWASCPLQHGRDGRRPGACTCGCSPIQPTECAWHTIGATAFGAGARRAGSPLLAQAQVRRRRRVQRPLPLRGGEPHPLGPSSGCRAQQLPTPRLATYGYSVRRNCPGWGSALGGGGCCAWPSRGQAGGGPGTRPSGRARWRGRRP